MRKIPTTVIIAATAIALAGCNKTEPVENTAAPEMETVAPSENATAGEMAPADNATADTNATDANTTAEELDKTGNPIGPTK